MTSYTIKMIVTSSVRFIIFTMEKCNIYTLSMLISVLILNFQGTKKAYQTMYHLINQS